MSMLASAVRVGELACQKNTFLRELTATVVSCEAAAHNSGGGGGGKKKSNKAAANNTTTTNNNNTTTGGAAQYELVLSDSVLFPEGGGQPCDHGTLYYDENVSVPITSVQRRGDVCLLSSPAAIPVGTRVREVLDWRRRLDHMQHHTGQHLLTAIVERGDTLALPTISWSLTHPFCFIQLDLAAYLVPEAAPPALQPYTKHITAEKKISEEMCRRIEELCNEAIQRALPVTCTTFDSREAYELQRKQQQQEEEQQQEAAAKDSEEKEAAGTRRSRDIPHDVHGPIRLIDIDDGRVDRCTCCGTHLRSLAELNVLHVLHQEVKNTTVKLYFVTGARALRLFRDMYWRERGLMGVLGGGGVAANDLVALAARHAKEMAEMTKKNKRWALELATYTAAALVQELRQVPRPVVALRRDDVEQDFFQRVRQELDAAGLQGVCLVAAWALADTSCGTTALPQGSLMVAKKDVEGQVMVVGPAEGVEEMAKVVQGTLTSVRGKVSKLGFRGKGSLREWAALEAALRDYKSSSS